MAAVGRVEPKTTQGCLPKSCHSLNLGMENFASILGDRFWPVGHCDERPLSGIGIQWQLFGDESEERTVNTRP
jgi:hypothetical protein